MAQHETSWLSQRHKATIKCWTQTTALSYGQLTSPQEHKPHCCKLLQSLQITNLRHIQRQQRTDTQWLLLNGAGCKDRSNTLEYESAWKQTYQRQTQYRRWNRIITGHHLHQLPNGKITMLEVNTGKYCGRSIPTHQSSAPL